MKFGVASAIVCDVCVPVKPCRWETTCARWQYKNFGPKCNSATYRASHVTNSSRAETVLSLFLSRSGKTTPNDDGLLFNKAEDSIRRLPRTIRRLPPKLGDLAIILRTFVCDSPAHIKWCMLVLLLVIGPYGDYSWRLEIRSLSSNLSALKPSEYTTKRFALSKRCAIKKLKTHLKKIRFENEKSASLLGTEGACPYGFHSELKFDEIIT